MSRSTAAMASDTSRGLGFRVQGVGFWLRAFHDTGGPKKAGLLGI